MTKAIVAAQMVRIKQLEAKIKPLDRAIDEIWETIWLIDPNLLPGVDEAPTDPKEQCDMIKIVLAKMGRVWQANSGQLFPDKS